MKIGGVTNGNTKKQIKSINCWLKITASPGPNPTVNGNEESRVPPGIRELSEMNYK